MKRLKINKEQYNTILLKEQEARLKEMDESIGKTLGGLALGGALAMGGGDASANTSNDKDKVTNTVNPNSAEQNIKSKIESGKLNKADKNGYGSAKGVTAEQSHKMAILYAKSNLGFKSGEMEKTLTLSNIKILSEETFQNEDGSYTTYIILTANLNEGVSRGLIGEGTKEVVLGVGLMLGLKLTGQNDAIAHDVVTSPAIMSEIKTILEDEKRIKELVDLLSEKGMKNPEDKLAEKATKIVTKYNKLATEIGIDERITMKGIYNLKSLDPDFGG